MRPFNFISATDKKEALNAVSTKKSSKYLGGGTNLVDLMKENVERPGTIIEVANLDYKTVDQSNRGGYTIGAMLSNSETANHDLIRTQYPLLSMAMLSAATAQIRNMATNGGNLLQRTRCPYFYEVSMPCNKREPGTGCGAKNGMNALHAIFGYSDKCVAVHPSDMCVALAALDAEVEVSSPGGKLRTIAFKDFHRLPGLNPERDTNLEEGELITAIHLPRPIYQHHYHYLKIRERSSYAFALVSVAAGMQVENGKISALGLAMGGVAHKPWKLTAAEDFLKGKTPNEANFERAAQLAMQDARPLSENGYKVSMGEKAIIRALSQAYTKTI
ncbi:FAD binding domain-containing protein [Flavobacterium rhizosphaerae]|uniref:Xanthine dehydrogenase family protein subunit M n=1 Tax=Flavobacterium rhizosphaerae TaxID=3163298 RepID=A0ABW8YX64_9FLAO